MRIIPMLVILGPFTAGCTTDAARYAQATCVLVDTSGTYVDQRQAAIETIKRGLLPQMLPGDTLAVVRIDGDSYEKNNLEARLTLEGRPSQANAQKLAFSRALDGFGQRKTRSRYSDISGGVMLCGEYLTETAAGSRAIVVFSDMLEELPRGAKRTFETDELAHTHVLAMNVKKLKSDNYDPARYRKRLAGWERRVTAGGAAHWQVVHDPAKLLAYLEENRL